MKKNFLNYQSLAIALFVSVASFPTTVWGLETSTSSKNLQTVQEDVLNPTEDKNTEDAENAKDSAEQNKPEDTQAPTEPNKPEDTQAPTEQDKPEDTKKPTEETEDVIKPEVLVPAEKTEKPALKNAPLTLVPTVETSRPEGTYQSYDIIYVMLTAPEGYSIYYSLDGSKATEKSILFTKPFAIEAPDSAGGEVTLHAIAILQEEVREDIEEEVKEEVKEEIKEEVKEEVKEDSKEEIKEDSKEEVKEDSKEEVKEDSKEEVKEESKEEVKEDSKEEIKEDSKEEITDTPIDKSQEKAGDVQ